MLTKSADQVLIPGTPGQTALPERVVCTPVPSQPPAGEWRTVCSVVNLFVGWDNGPATFDNPGPFPKPIYLPGGVVCRSEYLPSPVPPQPAPPPVCTTLPARPAIPFQPSRIESVQVRAWNAGANSEQEIEGDARVTFTIGQVLGSIIGFTQNREDVIDPDRTTHAFAFTTSQNGAALAQVREGAKTVTPPLPYVAGATSFEIRRTGGVVRYLRDGTVIYTSRVPSAGALTVGCAVYASGDRLP